MWYMYWSKHAWKKLWVNELRTKHAWSNWVRCISFILLGLEAPLAAGNVWHTYLNTVTVLHVFRVMYMHTVTTVHNIFKKECLLQYLFSLCDKLLNKGRGVGKSTKPLMNHIKFPAGSKQWQFQSEKITTYTIHVNTKIAGTESSCVNKL